MRQKESDEGEEGIRMIANAVKVGQRWERLIAGPSGWKPREIKRGGEREG